MACYLKKTEITIKFLKSEIELLRKFNANNVRSHIENTFIVSNEELERIYQDEIGLTDKEVIKLVTKIYTTDELNCILDYLKKQ